MSKQIKIATFYFIASAVVTGVVTMYVLYEMQRAKRKYVG